jgi:hypothetical protein
MRRSATAFVVDPAVVPAAADSPARSRDRHAVEHLITTAADTVREVARMQSAADGQGQRLLTFTLDAEVAFRHPSDVHGYADALASAMAEVGQRFHDPAGRRFMNDQPSSPEVAPVRLRTSDSGVVIEVTVAAPIATVWEHLSRPRADRAMARLGLRRPRRGDDPQRTAWS